MGLLSTILSFFGGGKSFIVVILLLAGVVSFYEIRVSSIRNDLSDTKIQLANAQSALSSEVRQKELYKESSENATVKIQALEGYIADSKTTSASREADLSEQLRICKDLKKAVPVEPMDSKSTVKPKPNEMKGVTYEDSLRIMRNSSSKP